MSQNQKNQDDVSNLPLLSEICNHFKITPHDLARILRNKMLTNKRFWKAFDAEEFKERDRLQVQRDIVKYQYQILKYERKLKNEEAANH